MFFGEQAKKLVAAFVMAVAIPGLVQAQFVPAATYLRGAQITRDFSRYDEFTNRYRSSLIITDNRSLLELGWLGLERGVFFGATHGAMGSDRYVGCERIYILADGVRVPIEEDTVLLIRRVDDPTRPTPEILTWAMSTENALIIARAQSVRLRICQDIYELPDNFVGELGALIVQGHADESRVRE